jgi:hypothetical protein
MPKSLASGESGELQLPSSLSSEMLEDSTVKLESSGGAASMIAAFTGLEPTGRDGTDVLLLLEQLGCITTSPTNREAKSLTAARRSLRYSRVLILYQGQLLQ